MQVKFIFFEKKRPNLLQKIPSPKLVSTTLWNVIKNKDISVAVMASRYLDLKLFLQGAVSNIEEFMLGEAKLYSDVAIKRQFFMNL